LSDDNKQNLEHTISGWASAFSREDTSSYEGDLSLESGLDSSSEARIVQILGLHCLSVLKDSLSFLLQFFLSSVSVHLHQWE
jgi:hypothetical protein